MRACCEHARHRARNLSSPVLEIFDHMKTYFVWLGENKKISKDVMDFIEMRKYLIEHLKLLLSFSLCIMNDLEPVLFMYQAEKPLAPFLYEKRKTREVPIGENNLSRGPRKQYLKIAEGRFTVRGQLFYQQIALMSALHQKRFWRS